MDNESISYFTSDNDVCKILAQRIKKERIAQQITQEDMAYRANVSSYAVRNFEQKGEITLGNLVAVLGALNKKNVLSNLFDFTQERIEFDAFEYLENLEKKYNKKRVRHAKS